MAQLETPRGQCPQCWDHAHRRDAHKGLGHREDCPACVDHLINGCPYLVPKKPGSWW